MNKARIIIGVCLGVALVHLGLDSQRNGAFSASPWMLALFGAIFGWFAWDGIATGRAVFGPSLVAERENNPVGFWLVICFWAALSLLGLSVPLLAPAR